VVHFKNGTSAPTIGEVLVGETSGDYGIIDNIVVTGGTYAGGDAAGVVFLSNLTGYENDTMAIFQDGENLIRLDAVYYGQVTYGLAHYSLGYFSMVDGYTGVIMNGILHPYWNLIEYKGKKYCQDHFEFRFKQEWADDSRIDINENQRGK
jgi:hypothetical protein